MSSVVLVAGGYRTGTTLAYMLVQRVLQAVGQDFTARGVNASTVADALLLREPWVVLKGHDVALPENPARHRVIWCDRDPVDAVASRTRFVPLEQAVEEWRDAASLRAFYAAGRLDVLWLDYERHYTRPRARAVLIAAHLGFTLPEHEVAAIVTDLTPVRMKRIADGLDQADSWTELRPGHVGEELGRPVSASPATRAAVRAALTVLERP